MIKAWDRCGRVTVTFTLPAAVGAAQAVLCGEWNNWAPDKDVMVRSEGGFVLRVPLEAGRAYRFRYLLDGCRWENDWAADRYVPNGYGSEDSVVDLTQPPGPVQPADEASLPAHAESPADPAGSAAASRPDERPDAPVPPPGEISPGSGAGSGAEAGSEASPGSETEAAPEAAPGAGAAPAASASSSIEREAKLTAPAGLGLPDLDELVPGTRAVTLPVLRLDATYYDTADLRLARSGITVRYRGGEPGPAWTVKLPEDGAGSDLVRREIRFDGSPDRVPEPAADLVLASTRSLTIQPVARLTTVRRPIEIRDGKGHLLAQVVDDTVSVSRETGAVGRFREVEVELHTNGAKGRRVLGEALSRLVGAGCHADTPMPKLVRALGEPATRPPDVVVPPLPEGPSVIDVARHATARAVAEILRYDPVARLGVDDEDVHKLRVATRRLRSDLHSFAPVVDESRVEPIRAELRWLGAMIGAVRDTDVLTIRLTARLAALSECETHGADRLLALLEERSAEARVAMMAALRDPRYLRLLDALVALAAAPPFLDARPAGRRKSRKLATKIAEKPWRRVVAAVSALGTEPSDAKLHEVRVLAKRSRYAAEATAPVLGPAAVRFAAAVADVQTVLGDHQDTVLAEEWLLHAAGTAPEVTGVVQQLIAVEQSRRRTLRTQWPAAWQRAVTKALP